MGKVGSLTITHSLLDAYESIGIQVPIYHVHILTEFDTLEQKVIQEWPNPMDILQASAEFRKLRKKIDENPAQHWKIVSLVREPVARNVATLFQNLSEFVPDWHQRYADGKLRQSDIRELQEWLINTSTISDIPDQWFDQQIKQIPAFGIDVYAELFPKEVGYKIYRGNAQADLLVIRLENLNECSQKAMREFFGFENFTLHNSNIGEQKDYTDLYNVFRKHPLPVTYVQKIYNTRFAHHFYTDAELEVFKKRWTS